jgi:hypothetical protein
LPGVALQYRKGGNGNMSRSGSVSSPESLSSSGRMSSARTWIFAVLTLAGTGLFLYSWFQPWWQAYIVALDEIAAVIRPWGLESHMPMEYSAWLTGAEMPPWFAAVAWAYLWLTTAALLFSLFVGEDRVALGRFKPSLQKALVGGVGLSYILVVVACVIVISVRAPEFYGASVVGTVLVSMSDHETSDVDTNLLLGYWLACGVGPLLVVLALFRDKIKGIPRLNVS